MSYTSQFKKLPSKSTLNSSLSGSTPNEDSMQFSPQSFLYKSPVKRQKEKTLAYSRIFRNGSMKDLHSFYRKVNQEENSFIKKKEGKKTYPISDIRTKIQKLSKQLSSEMSGFNLNKFTNVLNSIKGRKKENKVDICVMSAPLLYKRSFSTENKREKKNYLNIKEFTNEIRKNLFKEGNVNMSKTKICLY